MAADVNAAQASSTSPPVDDRGLVPKPRIYGWLSSRAAWILGLDIVLVIVFGILSPHGVFFTTENMQFLLENGTEALLLATGLALFVGAGQFDLSLGSNLVLSSVVGGTVMKDVAGTVNASGAYPHVLLATIVGLLACIATGALFGLVNGVLIGYVGIDSLIATLGTLGIGTGLALVVAHGADVSGLPPQLQTDFGLSTVGSFPVPAILAIVLGILVGLMVRYSRFGLRILAIGSSRPAAERVGLRTQRYLLGLAMLAGAFAGLAGFVDLAHYASTSLQGHANDALNAITAVVIGGTLLEGGRISIPGVFWGTGLAVILQGGLVVCGVSSDYQLIAVGVALIFAVGIDRLAYKRRMAD